MVGLVDKSFGGSIPDIYDDYLVPLIFEEYADDLARRTASLEPSDILEVAAGSGVVTRAVARKLVDSATYVVTDLNPPMLERAQTQQPDDARISWQPADAMDLPFPDGSFDLILCQFGAMFFPDRVQAYSEARRVLRGGGTFTFNMWDRIENNEFACTVTRSVAELYPDDPPRFLARTPHGHYDPATYERELRQAGFTEINVELVERSSRADTPAVPAIAYCQGTPLRNEIEQRNPDGVAQATIHAESALRDQFGTGPIEGKVRGFVVSAG